MRKYIFLLFFILCSFSVLAHQPRIAGDSDFDNPIEVVNPEISKAFYGELDGSPDFFRIDSDVPFRFYVNVLVPGRELTHTLSVEISGDEGVIDVLDGSYFEWFEFYEEYGRDWYMWGPEFKEDVSAGVYYVKVFNEGNIGKYSLAVGDVEEFPFLEIVKAAILVPFLKVSVFGKYYLLLPLVILFVIFYLIRHFYKKK